MEEEVREVESPVGRIWILLCDGGRLGGLWAEE